MAALRMGYFEIPVDNFLFMQEFEGEYHLSKVELSFLLAKALALEMEEHFSTRIKLEKEVKVPLRLERGIEFGNKGKILQIFRHNFFFPENLFNSLKFHKI